MTPEQRKRWTDALRSGTFAQGSGWLNSENKFCCLGVACEVFAEEVPVAKKEVRYTSLEPTGYSYVIYENGSGTLPPSMQSFLGLDEVGTLPAEAQAEFPRDEGLHPSLVYLNDQLKYNFNQIADVIDKYFGEEPKQEEPVNATEP